MTNYIVEVQESDQGELFIEFPDELIDELGWQEGDILNWDLKGEGIVLSKTTRPFRLSSRRRVE
jgi:bifunctional DNA-binding transcriptional regulator/antitoxin component of YhaV-PrlF toxin-antitoxin module